jgi:uncharacterized protein YycO
MKDKFAHLILLTTVIFFTACGGGEKKEPYYPLTKERVEKMYHDYSSFVEENLVYRVYAIKSFDTMKEHDPLTGDDHNTIDTLLLNHLKTEEELKSTIKRYQYLVEESNGYTQKERLELVMTSLSAMLLRYDHYLLAYSNYENHDKLRVRLNEKNHNIPKNTLKEITNTYHAIKERRDVKKMVNFYRKNIEAFEGEKEPYFLYLKALIEQSATYKLGFDDDKEYGIESLRTLYTHTFDWGGLGIANLTNEFSRGFGNSAGLVETRKGKLYDKGDITAYISANLRAGDILLEKTPFRLTDKLIPGHWGHAAVYVGTVDELKELGIWEHEAVKPYHAQLEEGKLIVEALRDGVQLNSVAHFLNIDDFATMRDTQASDAKRIERILLNFKQLGKDYDFNFDIETADKIVCSELVYITFIGVDWETEEVAGTHTISPDNVANKSIEESSDFAITLLYHDGEEIGEDRKNEMKKLLESK